MLVLLGARPRLVITMMRALGIGVFSLVVGLLIVTAMACGQAPERTDNVSASGGFIQIEGSRYDVTYLSIGELRCIAIVRDTYNPAALGLECWHKDGVPVGVWPDD